MTEWYVSMPTGLLQGWTISSRPATQAMEWLCLYIEAETQLSASVDLDERGIHWRNDAGQTRLTYGGLRAVDAFGTELACRMSVRGRDICIAVNDLEAHYPITVDPALSTPLDYIPQALSSMSWGSSVSIADFNHDGCDDVLIGAPNTSGTITGGPGTVRINFGSRTRGVRPALTITFQGAIGFGRSTAVLGDVNGDGKVDILVGEERDTTLPVRGRAQVYSIPLSSPPPGAVWSKYGAHAGADFGFAVAGVGDLDADGFPDFMVSAPGQTLTVPSEGAVHIYKGGAGALQLSEFWSVGGGQSACDFGHSIASAGDVNGDSYTDIIVGAPAYDNGQMDEGRALLFLGGPSGPSSVPSWTAESDQDGAQFGFDVACAGDINSDGFADVIVGAPGFDEPTRSDAGRAYVFLGSPSGLSAQPSWVASGEGAYHRFGVCVVGVGDLNQDGFEDVSVGADGVDLPLRPSAGMAYTFLGSAAGMLSPPFGLSGGSLPGAHYGLAIGAGDLNGDGHVDLVVGAPRRDTQLTGRVHYLLGEANVIDDSPHWTATGDRALALFGKAVAGACDVNGDGYDDILASGNWMLVGDRFRGYVTAHHGGPGQPGRDPSWRVATDQPDDEFGSSISSAGDVNGDGFDDVIIGADKRSNGQALEGSAYVFLGSASGLSTSYSWSAESDVPSARFGMFVAGAGDVDADGFDDVLVAAPFFSGTMSGQGRVYLFRGSAQGLSPAASWSVVGTSTNDNLGRGIASAGDINGDGFGDVLVSGASVSLYTGGPFGLTATPAWETGPGAAFVTSYGRGVCAGDVNGDGYSDVLVGEESGSVSFNLDGRAMLFTGSPTGLSNSPFWLVSGDKDVERLGGIVSAAGDVDGDGFSDVLVGSTSEEKVLLYRGAASSMSRTPAWRVGSSSGSLIVQSVTAAGDVDGDGLDEVLVGSMRYSSSVFGAGRITLHGHSNPPIVADCNGNGQSDASDIVYGLETDVDLDFVPDTCQPPMAISVCDALTGPSSCPCGNTGAPGHGCTNSLPGSVGAKLGVVGTASISNDTLRFVAEGVAGPVVFYAIPSSLGSSQVAGDGLSCISGANFIRLGVAVPLGTSGTFPSSVGGVPVHSIQGLTAPRPVTYQAMYRDGAQYCTPFFSNLTQALVVYWVP